MTALHEALVLPCLFLTVILVASLRPAGEVALVPPSLASLVAAMVLFAIYVRSGVLAADRLMNHSRSALANLNGFTVLLAAFLASAQVITLAVPATGLPALIAWTMLVSLLLQALAIGPDRTRLLRGLLVIFGAAFTLKFVILAAITASAEGRVARALQLLFEGVTLGTIKQPETHPAEGYLAFGALVLYLIGVAWLPPADWRMVRVESSDTLLVQENQQFHVSK